jgi:hypothetical protein
MKKLIFPAVAVSILTFISCQKDYVCNCTHASSGVSSYEETYKGTVFAKKAATKSCKDNMNIEMDSLSNCSIK